MNRSIVLYSTWVPLYHSYLLIILKEMTDQVKRFNIFIIIFDFIYFFRQMMSTTSLALFFLTWSHE